MSLINLILKRKTNNLEGVMMSGVLEMVTGVEEMNGVMQVKIQILGVLVVVK